MKTLGLDIGTKAGWTVSEGELILASGTYVLATEQELQQQRREGKERTLDVRFSRLLAFVNQQIAAGIGRVVFEDVQFCKNQAQAQLWASLRGAIWAAAIHSPVEVCCVQVGTLKRFATGTGRSQKSDMARVLANAEPLLYRLTEDFGLIRTDGSSLGDDEVDAIWLARFAMAVDCGEQRFTSGFERKAARKQERRAKRSAAKAKRKARRQAAKLAAQVKRQARRAKTSQARKRGQVTPRLASANGADSSSSEIGPGDGHSAPDSSVPIAITMS